MDTARTENAFSDVVLEPSLTRIWMLFHNPTAVGLPLSLPVLLLKLAQLGLFAIVNFSVCLSASLAVGVKEYVELVYTQEAGEPEIFGAAAKATCALANRPIKERPKTRNDLGNRNCRAET